MRMTPIAGAAALLAAAALAGCDEDEPRSGAALDTGEVKSGETASGGSGLAETETDTDIVEDLPDNPDLPDTVAEDPEATPGAAGPNRPQGVAETPGVEDGRTDRAVTGSAEMETEQPDNLDVEVGEGADSREEMEGGAGRQGG